MVDRFPNNLGLTHFTGVRKGAVEIDKSVNQSLERRVWGGRCNIGRSREGVRRLGGHGGEKPCKDFPAGIPLPPFGSQITKAGEQGRKRTKGFCKQLEEGRPSETRFFDAIPGGSWLRRVNSRAQRLNFEAP